MMALEWSVIVDLSLSGYKNLTYYEHLLIGQYLNSFDKSIVTELLLSDEPLSRGGREFINDVLTGKLKKPKGKRNNNDTRDYEIHWRASLLLYRGHTFRMSKDKEGIAEILADMFNVSDEVVLSAYRKIKGRRKEGERSTVDEFRKMEAEDPKTLSIIENVYLRKR